MRITALPRLNKMFRLLIPALLLISIIPVINRGRANSDSGPSCPNGMNLGISGGGSTSGTIGGLVTVILGNSTTNTQPIAKVIIRANGQPIGRAQPNSSYAWSLPWVTSLHPNGGVVLDAEVYIEGMSNYCNVTAINKSVYNPTPSNLVAVAQPQSWQGPMSFSFPITVSANVNSPAFDAGRYSLYYWQASIGNVVPNFHQAQFSSGQTVGNGAVGVKVRYGGDEALISIPVSVKAPDSPLPQPTSTSTTGDDSDTDDTDSTTSTSGPGSTSGSSSRQAAVQNNPVVQDCTVAALGEKRFKAINSGSDRPSSKEINKFKVCFSSSNYIIPSNFSPVKPDTIEELPKTDAATVDKLENVLDEKEAGQVKVLKLSGKAKPSSLVLVYIFSDPLVFTTTADSNGNWTYTLEDPIEPGSHEVYSVVDRGDGVYERSNPLSFVIGTAEAAEANPGGLSLQLIEEPTPAQSNRSLIFYGAAAAFIVLVPLLSLVLLLKRRSAKNQAMAVASAPQPAAITSPVSPEATIVTPPDSNLPKQ